MKKKLYAFALILALAVISTKLNSYFHFVSASVFSLGTGMLMSSFIRGDKEADGVVSFMSKRGLRISIVLMGLNLSLLQVFQVGKFSLIVMTFTLITAFGGGYLVGKLFKMNWELSSLISAGTGICGGSAIAAIAPTIEAEDKDIAYAISATFIFDVVMILLFPLMGRYFGMSDMGFGLWAGTAINDTSSVVAAGYAFSDMAGNYALIVKLTRTLSIVPAVIIFSAINSKVKKKNTGGKRKISNAFPGFILLFLLMVALKSFGLVSNGLSTSTYHFAKFLMLMALVSIGLKTDFREVSKSGIYPMIHGFIISLLVVVVSFVVQLALHQV